MTQMTCLSGSCPIRAFCLFRRFLLLSPYDICVNSFSLLDAFIKHTMVVWTKCEIDKCQSPRQVFGWVSLLSSTDDRHNASSRPEANRPQPAAVCFFVAVARCRAKNAQDFDSFRQTYRPYPDQTSVRRTDCRSKGPFHMGEITSYLEQDCTILSGYLEQKKGNLAS